MTYDELLYKISTSGDTSIDFALRAVVELTAKDIKHESYVWLDGYSFAMKQVIQAIEKELT